MEPVTTIEEPQMWALHIAGPDDMIPAPSKGLAQAAADLLNSHFKGEVSGVMLSASVIPWPYSPESHQQQVDSFCDEWIIPKLMEPVGFQVRAYNVAQACWGQWREASSAEFYAIAGKVGWETRKVYALRKTDLV